MVTIYKFSAINVTGEKIKGIVKTPESDINEVIQEPISDIDNENITKDISVDDAEKVDEILIDTTDDTVDDAVEVTIDEPIIDEDVDEISTEDKAKTDETDQEKSSIPPIKEVIDEDTDMSDYDKIMLKLKKRGYTDIIIKKHNILFLEYHLSYKDLSIMTRQMACVLGSDMPLADGILMIIEQTKNQNLSIAFDGVYDSIISEMTLLDAMEKEEIFPKYLLSLISIGENSNKYEEIFNIASDYYSKEQKIKDKLRRSVSYPLTLSLFMIWVIGLLIIKVLPIFEDMLISMGGSLPKTTMSLINISRYVTLYGVIFICALAIIALISMFVYGTKNGRMFFHRLRLYNPITKKFQQKSIAYKFAMSMSMLLDNGLNIEEAMLKTSDIMDNVYISNLFKKAIIKIRKGDYLSTTIAKADIFPSMVIRMINVGEKTGKLASILAKSSAYYQEEVDRQLKKLTSLIEPLLIVILSVIIGVVLLSVMMPIINIMSLVG